VTCWASAIPGPPGSAGQAGWPPPCTTDRGLTSGWRSTWSRLLGNDAALSPSQATIQPLIETWLGTVLSAKPETVIFMTGPIIASNAGAAHTTVQAAKQAAAAKFPRNVAFIDTLTDPWVSGTGRDGATTGDGNRDWVCGTDSAHPTAEGHRMLAGRVARGVAKAIPALIAAQA
jgi:lysophospholipase L1-like esterase